MTYKRISPQPVVEGGTGASTFTSHGVLLGNTTSAITATTAGTTGQVLTGVTGSAPTFQAPAASSITITGDSGGGLTGNSFTFTGGSTGLTFAGASTTETLGGTLAIANGGTNATSMANADGVVYYDGTRFVTTTVGSATQVLTSNGPGMAPTFQPGGGGGGGALVLIQTLTATGSTALNFTTGITGTYNNYLLLCSNMTSASTTATAYCFVQLSVDGGGTYDTTNYEGFPGSPVGGLPVAQAGADWSVDAATATVSMPLNNLTSGSGYVFSITGYCLIGSTTISGTNSGFAGYRFTTANQTINALRIVMSDGAAFTGVFSLYGYAQ